MLDAVLLLSLAALAGQRAAVHPWASVGATLLAAFWMRRRVPAPLLAAGAVVCALSGARAALALREFDARLLEARAWLGPAARCTGQATVLTSPVRKGDALRWVGELSGLDCEGRVAPTSLRARLYGGPGDLARGDRVEVVAGLGPTQLFLNLDTADPRPGAARAGAVVSGGVVDARPLARGRGPGAWIDRLRAHVRARIEATYPESAAPLARALVLGEEDLAPEEGEAFRRSGLSHLLAVSGTHLVLVVAGLVGALSSLLAMTSVAARVGARPVAAAVGVPLAMLYADFAGGSGSAWRAALMLGALLGAEALGRRGDTPRALGLSLGLMLLSDPLAAFDLSLLLSAAATAGLLWLSPPIEAALSSRMPPALATRLSAPLATTLAATLACAPLLTVVSPELPVAGLLANLIAVPVGEAAALPVCILHTMMAGPCERGAALVGAGALLFVRAIAHGASAFPGVPLPPLTEAQGGLLAVGLVALAASRRRGAVACALAAALLLAEGAAVRAGAPRGQLRVTALDVGQGDSLLIDLPDGRAMLVDGGGFVGSPVDPGRSVVLPTLRARRRREVAVVALSHPHPDHFLGLASALPTIGVGEMWDTGQGEAEGAGPVYASMMTELHRRGVPVRGPAELCGAPRNLGGAQVEVLAPCPSFTPFINANDNSLVIRLSHGQRSVLLVGDAEDAEEHALIARHGERLRSDLLKVGHHGSRTSTGAPFLAAVRPSLAVVSCGARNRFGHPHPTPLATLAAAGVAVARTDHGGALLWSTDGTRVWTRRAVTSP